jgi:hypothetical protein
MVDHGHPRSTASVLIASKQGSVSCSIPVFSRKKWDEFTSLRETQAPNLVGLERAVGF